MRNGCLILLSMLGLMGCAGKHLLVGEDGAGGVGAAAGAPGSPSGTAGAGATANTGGSGGPGATTGLDGAVIQPVDAGTAIGGGLSVIPGAATFPSTLVEAVSAPKTFTVHNDGDVPVGTGTALSALVGTNAADFLVTSNGCGTAVQPGASCELAVAFAPKTRSGVRSAALAVGASAGTAANVFLSGTALPSLGLLAGNLGGPGNRDGTGAGARFNEPVGVASDGAGNLYVADDTNQTIRKVVIATGAVTTLAGAPGQYGAADGTGAAALFRDPFGIASDGAGNLYVADAGNNAIRKIVIATGVVSTFAGGGQAGSANDSGAAAQFRDPYGIASDGAGNLYVADTDNSTIRKIVIATKAVTTVAGSAVQTGSMDGTGAAALFDHPTGVACDGAGNLYVADYNNSTIRKIVIATRAVTTFAGRPGLAGDTDGTGTQATFNDPDGIAFDGAGALYVTDGMNNTIRKIVIATGAVTTFAGTTRATGAADGSGSAARFSQPNGVTSDGAGKLYVADAGNNTIRQIVITTASVTTLAGASSRSASGPPPSWSDSLNSPFGVASDGTGSLYVADTNNSLIRKVDIATGAITTLAGGSFAVAGADGTGTAANFGQPRGIAADGAGNLYVADTLNDTIRKIVIATGAVTTLADATGATVTVFRTSGVVADGAGNLYATDGRDTIRKIVIATGAVTILAGAASQSGSADGTGADARFAGPSGIATDGAGNLYVADSNTIRKIVIATGAVTTLAGAVGEQGTVDGIGAEARFREPWGIASDGAGNLFVADSGNETIRKIVIATGAVTTSAGTPGQTGSADGTGAAARFDVPLGIASDGAGNVYVADIANNSIRKIATASGTVTTVAPSLAPSVDGTGVAARFTNPTGIAGDGTGNLYVTDGDGTIRQIVAATRAVTTFAGAPGQQGDVDGMGGDARFTRPNAIFGDGAGNLFVADGVIIRQITLPARAVTTVAGTQTVRGVDNLFAEPTGVVSDGAGNIYVADYGYQAFNCVRKVVIATGAVTIVAGGDSASTTGGTGAGPTFTEIRGIATDGAGYLYVTDGAAIRQLNIATGVVTTLAGMALEAGSADGVGAAARFIGPSGIASDGAGALYVADSNTIRKIDIASATVSTVIGAFGQIGVSPGALPAALDKPVAVTVLPTGELAIVDSAENAVLIGHL